MKLITPELLAKEAPAEYKKLYGGDSIYLHPLQEKTWMKLDAIPPDQLNVENVRAILGASSFTVTACFECNAINIPIVDFGPEEPDHDDPGYRLCLPCLEKAVALIKAP